MAATSVIAAVRPFDSIRTFQFLQMTSRLSIRALLLVVAIMGVSYGSYVWVCKNGISTNSVWRIENGMTKSKLIELLGKPHRTYPTGDWEYDVWGFCGFVLVSFDENGCVDDWSI